MLQALIIAEDTVRATVIRLISGSCIIGCITLAGAVSWAETFHPRPEIDRLPPASDRLIPPRYFPDQQMVPPASDHLIVPPVYDRPIVPPASDHPITAIPTDSLFVTADRFRRFLANNRGEQVICRAMNSLYQITTASDD